MLGGFNRDHYSERGTDVIIEIKVPQTSGYRRKHTFSLQYSILLEKECNQHQMEHQYLRDTATILNVESQKIFHLGINTLDF